MLDRYQRAEVILLLSCRISTTCSPYVFTPWIRDSGERAEDVRHRQHGPARGEEAAPKASGKKKLSFTFLPTGGGTCSFLNL